MTGHLFEKQKYISRGVLVLITYIEDLIEDSFFDIEYLPHHWIGYYKIVVTAEILRFI